MSRMCSVGGAAVCLALDGYDATGLCEVWDDASETCFDRRAAAVQKHERFAFAVDLVVHAEAVDLGVLSLGRCRGCHCH